MQPAAPKNKAGGLLESMSASRTRTGIRFVSLSRGRPGVLRAVSGAGIRLYRFVLFVYAGHRHGGFMKDRQSLNYKLAVTGAFGALSVILGITGLGFISLSPAVSFTILQVPVILATVLAGLVPGMGVGFIFGLFSLVKSATNPSGALDPLFTNPVISIVPRVLIAVVTWLVYRLFSGLLKAPKAIGGGIGAAFGSLANSFFVIGAIYMLYNSQIKGVMGGAGFWAGMALVLVPGGLLEAAASVVLTVAVMGGLFIVRGKKSKLSQEAE